jgi:hypothetical protein
MINYDDDDDGDEEQEAKEEILSLTEQQPSPTLPRNPPPSRSISELLWHRELAGTLSYRHPERLSLYRKVVMGDLAPTGEQLACSIAWYVGVVVNRASCRCCVCMCVCVVEKKKKV